MAILGVKKVKSFGFVSNLHPHIHHSNCKLSLSTQLNKLDNTKRLYWLGKRAWELKWNAYLAQLTSCNVAQSCNLHYRGTTDNFIVVVWKVVQSIYSLKAHWHQFPCDTLTYLKNCEVLQHTVHHVLFRQLFKFVNKIDHVFAHWGPVNAVNKPTVFEVAKFSLKERRKKKSTFMLESTCIHSSILVAMPKVHICN